MHYTTTPTLLRRRALRVHVVAAPAAIGTVLLWGFQVMPTHRPHLVMMLFLLFLGTAVGSAVVAAVAHCQLTVQRAFLAGLGARDAMGDPGRPTPLRVVD